jgi:hypothetical protein
MACHKQIAAEVDMYAEVLLVPWSVSMSSGRHCGITEITQLVSPSFREVIFVVRDKFRHRAVRVIFLPFGIHVMDGYATGASTKHPEKCMMDHMSSYAT